MPFDQVFKKYVFPLKKVVDAVNSKDELLRELAIECIDLDDKIQNLERDLLNVREKLKVLEAELKFSNNLINENRIGE